MSGHHVGSPGTNGVAYVSCGLMYCTVFISHFSKAPITTSKLPKCMDESCKQEFVANYGEEDQL